MTMFLADWARRIEARLPVRPNLSSEALWLNYFSDVPRDAFEECLNYFRNEYPLPLGVLRPEDKLDDILAPVSTLNPLKWVVFRGLESDGVDELQHQLATRIRNNGSDTPISAIRTFGDLVRAWCGGSSGLTSAR